MKKYFVTMAVMALMTACGGNSGDKQAAADTSAATPAAGTAKADPADITTNPDYAKGLELIGKSDCLTCHKVTEKLIGPAYQDVANKYAGSDTAIAYLSHKVIKGGKGVWGEIPMTPHPQLAQADVEQMIKYILLLKTK